MQPYNHAGPTLDDAPPDWRSYADTTAWWAAECNRFSPPARRTQAAPTHPDLITTEEESDLMDWLYRESV